jgi:hypothetical protein
MLHRLQMLESNIHAGILQRRRTVQILPHTAQNSPAASSRFTLSQDARSMPRVPAVLHFSKSSFMGVVYPRCTEDDHTLAWAQVFPTLAPRLQQESTGTASSHGKVTSTSVLGGLHHEYQIKHSAA